MNLDDLKTCYTCLHGATDLTNLLEEDADNVTYHTKLLKLLKVELISQDSMGICTNCIAELRVAYKFLESVKYTQQFWKKQTEVTIHIEEILPEENNVDKSEEILPEENDVVIVDGVDKSEEILPEENDVTVDSVDNSEEILPKENDVIVDSVDKSEGILPEENDVVIVDADDKYDDEPDDVVVVEADDKSDGEPENIEASSVGNADVNDDDTRRDSGSVCDVTMSDDYIECANCTKVYPGRKFLSHDCFKAGTQVRIKKIINNNDKKEIPKDTFYECHICKKLYNRKSRLTQHIASMHGKGEASNSSNDLVSVVGDIIFKKNEPNNDNGFTCSKCSKTWEEFSDDFLLHSCFSSGHYMRPKRERRKINYNENTSSRSKDETGTKRDGRKSRKIDFTCKICEKQCRNSLALKEHLTLHTGEKNFCCDLCGERFRLYSCLHRHKKLHSVPPGQRTRKTPFLCTVCGRNFPYSNSYQRHMRVHMGIRNHECQVCYRKFAVSTHLKVHMRTHTGEKPYTCDVCGQAFSLKPSRDKHMVKLHGYGPSSYNYTCNVCGESFRKDAELQSHLKGTHCADSDDERKEAVGQIIGSYLTFHEENIKYE